MSKKQYEIPSIPSILSYRRNMVINDCAFFSVRNDGENYPIIIQENTILGLQNQYKDKDKAEVRNVQTTQTAKLNKDCKLLKLKFSFKPLDIHDSLHQADSLDYIRVHNNNLISHICNSNIILPTIAKRMIINILNGRWTWRNRICADTLDVSIFIDGKPLIDNFNALQLSLNDFDVDVPQEVNDLIEVLVSGWKGETHSTVQIVANIDFGVNGAEVYPSQPFTDSVNVSRRLFGIGSNNQAAFRAEKIWNAIRTIDTWYPDYDDIKEPIPVEPIGSSSKFKTKFRSKGSKNNIYDLLDQAISELSSNDNQTSCLSDNDWLFISTCIIQGGVFGKKR